MTDLSRWTDAGNPEAERVILEMRLRGLQIQWAKVLSVALHGNGEHWVKLKVAGMRRTQLRFYKRKPGWAFVGRHVFRIRGADGFSIPQHLNCRCVSAWP